MRTRSLVYAVIVAAVPASAQELGLGIDLMPGHPIYHESEKEAGVAMALSIGPIADPRADLTELCEELRLAARLGKESGDQLRLETIFIVPYKAMAVEGYYLPDDGNFDRNALVPGDAIPRPTLDEIVARAGIPPRVLDETNVEHEISCSPGEPLWSIAWYDVRPIGEEEPDTVIGRARQRFLAIHQSVVEHRSADQHAQEVQRATSGG